MTFKSKPKKKTKKTIRSRKFVRSSKQIYSVLLTFCLSYDIIPLSHSFHHNYILMVKWSIVQILSWCHQSATSKTAISNFHYRRIVDTNTQGNIFMSLKSIFSENSGHSGAVLIDEFAQLCLGIIFCL